MAKAPKPNRSHTFVLNDESQKNAYGFRVPNAVLSLERFRSNPVVLDSHQDNTESVVGRWENLRIDGPRLLADAHFDEGDESAQKLAGKVERGFVRGCSIGFIAAGFKKGKDGVPEITGGELLEASICAIPANATALKLYAPDGTRLTADEIKLSVTNTLSTSTNPLSSKMDKLLLSPSALVALGFTKTPDEGDGLQLSASIERLSTDLTASKAKITELEAKLSETVKLQSKALLDAAEAEGRFLPAERPMYEQLAAANYELCANSIAKLPVKTTLANQVSNPAGGGTAPADLDAFVKLSVEEQLAFKKNNPAEYAKLVK